MPVTKGGKTVILPEGTPALSYERMAALAAVTALPSIPTRANWARIFVESGSVRFRDDGADPTATVGAPWAAGAYFETFDLTAARLLETAAGSIVTVEYHE